MLNKKSIQKNYLLKLLVILFILYNITGILAQTQDPRLNFDLKKWTDSELNNYIHSLRFEPLRDGGPNRNEILNYFNN